jgi:hypothetical protein
VDAAQHRSRLERDLVHVANTSGPGDFRTIAIGCDGDDPAKRLCRALELAKRDQFAALKWLFHDAR